MLHLWWVLSQVSKYNSNTCHKEGIQMYILDGKSVTRTRTGPVAFVAQCVLWISGHGLIEKDHIMHFAVLMVWREPKDHTCNCYFAWHVWRHSCKSKHPIKYPTLRSALRPMAQQWGVTCSWGIRVMDALMYLDDREMNVDYMDHNTVCVLPNSEEPHLINQAKLNYLVWDI